MYKELMPLSGLKKLQIQVHGFSTPCRNFWCTRGPRKSVRLVIFFRDCAPYHVP